MKSEINLLPYEARILRMERVLHARIIQVLSACIYAVSIVFAVCVSVLWINQFILTSLDDRLVLQGKSRAEIAKEIKKINTLTATMTSRIDAKSRWLVHMPDVLTAVPSGMVITKIAFIEKPESLQITGKSTKGSLAVVYQKALEGLSWVDHVNAPLQNFARAPEATVTFTIIKKTGNTDAL